MAMVGKALGTRHTGALKTVKMMGRRGFDNGPGKIILRSGPRIRARRTRRRRSEDGMRADRTGVMA
jgi:hypothetical protein